MLQRPSSGWPVGGGLAARGDEEDGSEELLWYCRVPNELVVLEFGGLAEPSTEF